MIKQTVNTNLNEIQVPAKEKLKRIYSTMIPICLTQLAMMGMNVVDTIMSGHAGAANLAGVAMGNNMWIPVFTCFGGVISALTPIIAQQRGAGDNNSIPKSVRHGIYISLTLAIFIIIAGYFSVGNLLSYLNLEKDVFNIATGYLGALAFGIIPLFVNVSLRSFVDTMGFTNITMKLFLLALPINAFFNYIMIFGKFGFPALGGIGAGWATSLTYWILLVIFLFTIFKVEALDKYKIFSTIGTLELSRLKEQLKIGTPLGISIFFETSVFSGIAFFIAKFGTVSIAAHQAAINFSSLLYMFPLSFSFALTILVGIEVGAKRYNEAMNYAKLGIISNVCLSFCFVLFLIFGRSYVAAIYSNDPAIIKLAASLMFYVAFFQSFDSIGAPIQGTLRGYKDVNYAFYTALFAYWVIGLPLGYFLDTQLNYGPAAYWQGIIAAVFASTVLLLFRLRYIKSNYQ